MSLPSDLLDHMPPTIAGADKPIMANRYIEALEAAGAMNPTCQYLSQRQRNWNPRRNSVSLSKASTLCVKLLEGSK